MKSIFPEKLVIKIIEKSTQKSVKGILCYVTVFATYRNNYTLMLTLTDTDGSTALTKQEIEKHIYESNAMFPMDYSSNLDGCKPTIEIEVRGMEEINIQKTGIETWKGISKTYEEDFFKLDNAQNFKIKPVKKEITFTGEKEVLETIEVSIQ